MQLIVPLSKMYSYNANFTLPLSSLGLHRQRLQVDSRSQRRLLRDGSPGCRCSYGSSLSFSSLHIAMVSLKLPRNSYWLFHPFQKNFHPISSLHSVALPLTSHHNSDMVPNSCASVNAQIAVLLPDTSVRDGVWNDVSKVDGHLLRSDSHHKTDQCRVFVAHDCWSVAAGELGRVRGTDSVVACIHPPRRLGLGVWERHSTAQGKTGGSPLFHLRASLCQDLAGWNMAQPDDGSATGFENGAEFRAALSTGLHFTLGDRSDL